MYRTWPLEKEAHLTQRYSTTPVGVLARECGVSIAALYAKANRMGLRKPRDCKSADALMRTTEAAGFKQKIISASSAPSLYRAGLVSFAFSIEQTQ
jgi:hypothetical protein